MDKPYIRSGVALAAVIGAVVVPGFTFAERQPTGRLAYRAEDFIETIAINASPFEVRKKNGKKGPAFAAELLFDLGVRHYRANLRCAQTPPDQPERMLAWWKKTGARPMVLLDPTWNRTLKADWLGVKEEGRFDDLLAELKRYAPGLISGVEAPNELNNKFGRDMNLKYKGRTDEAAGTLYQNDLYAAMKGDPATKDIPVILYTAIFSDYTLARSTDKFDFMNTHPYQGDNVPSSSLLMNMTRTMNLLPEGGLVKPFMPTECGYNVELDKTNGKGYTGSLRAQAYSEPMLFAEYFRHGIARTFLFALPNVDGYGLLESDTVTKRPSWYALESLIRILADAQWDGERMQWTGDRDFRPRALRFEVERAPDTVHTLTLQKANGDWYLLVWNEVRNMKNHVDLQNADVPVTLAFAEGTPVTCAGMWRQGEIPADVYGTPDGAKQGAFVPVAAPEVKDGRLAIGVPSRLVILRLVPGNRPGAEVVAPKLQTVRTEANAVTLAVEMPLDAAFAFVTLARTDMEVASVPRSAFTERDGRLVAEWTDRSAWMRPGLGYRFNAVAVAADGTESPRAETVAVTKPQRCDLIPSNVGVQEPAGRPLRPGDQVRFAADVTNVGDGPTPNPTQGEVGIYNSAVSMVASVDGKLVGWGGTRGSQPIQAGEAHRWATGGGPNGGKWVATEGTHVVRILVDDVGRISGERSKMNNLCSKSFTVGTYPGKLEFESCFSPRHVNLSAEGDEDWVAFTEWSNGEPARKRGAQLISAARQDGKGYVNVNSGCPISLAWGDDGTAPACADTHRGLWGNRVGNGYVLEVPASTEERTLKLYVGVTGGGKGELSLELSDGSAPKAVDPTWDTNRAKRWSPIPDEAAVCYTVRFKAAKDGEKLKVRWGLVDEPNGYHAQIRLQAATLSR